MPPSDELHRLRQRRAALGLPADDEAPLLIDAEGAPVPVEQVPLHLRRARLSGLGIETNGDYCKSLLQARYPTTETAGAGPAVGDQSYVPGRHRWSRWRWSAAGQEIAMPKSRILR